MQPGEKIRELREKKKLTQGGLGKMIDLTQGYISNVETGRQAPSPEFVSKISGPLEISKDVQSFLLGTTTAKTLRNIWPAIIKENHQVEFGIHDISHERRLPENKFKRKFIDNVVKILDSGNKKVIGALKSDVDVFLSTIELRKPEAKGGD